MRLLDDEADGDDNAWGRREAARMKQIQIGKARPEYQRYLREVPPSQRRLDQPSTPDPSARVSKRQFDRALADWRRLLHDYDLVPRGPPHGKNYQDDSEAPRGRHRQFREAAGEGRFVDYDDSRSSPQAFSRASRRSRVTVVHRGERSIGKFGPRKPANDTTEDETETIQLASEMEEARVAPEVPLGGAVRISLADQLWEMPFQQSPANASNASEVPVYGAWPWYEDQLWNNVEFQNADFQNLDFQTPEKMQMFAEMQQQYMLSMETPDKTSPMMPFHGLDAAHQGMAGIMNVDDSAAMGDSIVPNKLFDFCAVPETPEECQVVENNCSEIDAENLAPSNTAVNQNGEVVSSKEASGELSPRPGSNQREMLSLRSPSLRSPSLQLQSPSVACLASPTPRTPKRQQYVPDTPSPSRMHFSWMQPPNHVQSGYPWISSAAAFGAFQASPPEFLQEHLMPYS